MQKNNYRPCVGMVVLNSQRKIFVGQRIIPKSPYWQMPQGGIDVREDPKEAALRELKEETSIQSVECLQETKDWLFYDLPANLQGKLWKGQYKGQKQKWFLFSFTGKEDEIDLNTAHPEFSHWSWMDTADVLHHVVPFKKQIYLSVLKEFSLLS